MAWNEPGGGNKDPWNQGPRRANGGPPDLDQLFEGLKARLRGRGPGGGGGGGGFGGFGGGSLGLLLGAAVVLWLVLGFFRVDEQERGVVLRLGAYDRIADPGLRWRPWPVDSVEKVNVTQVRQVTERTDMLTQDENIVDVELKIQYRVSSATNYLFSLQDPDSTLRQVTKSAVREVIGRSKMDFVLSGEGRTDVAERTKQIMQERLDSYESGLIVAEVNLQNVQAPEPVQGAFTDVINAREDEVRLKNEAEAYANDRLPKSRGAAARELAEAIAYRDRRIAEAEGESARFTKLLAEYQKAPRVTRDRLYLETMSEVLGNATKILVDVDRNGPMIYLPLDQLNKNRGTEPPSDTSSSTGSGSRSSPSGGSDYRSRERGR